MTKHILIAFSLLLLGSCIGDIEFKRVESRSRNEASNFRDVFLVANAPRKKEVRDSLLIDFAEKMMPDFCSLDTAVVSYSIFFFESTWCTRNFDERNKGRSWSLSSDVEGCPEDEYSVFFWYKRSEENPNAWYLYLPKNAKDTIYCQ